MNIDDLYNKYKEMVEDRIGDIAEQYDNIVFTHAIRGGKRLRPVITVLISDTYGGDIDKALDLGTIVEITHSASLVLDDIIDNDDYRRGVPTAKALFGLARAVVTGLTMPSIAINIASNYDIEVVKQISDVWVEMANGAIMEVISPDLPATKLYNAIIDAKTAKLFSVAAKFGTMTVDDISDDDVNHIVNYGLYLGRAYQQADDYVDYLHSLSVGDVTGIGTEFMLMKGMDIDNMIIDFMNDLFSGSISIEKALSHLTNLLMSNDIEDKIYSLIVSNMIAIETEVNELSIDDDKKNLLIEFAYYVVNRMLKGAGEYGGRTEVNREWAG